MTTQFLLFGGTGLWVATVFATYVWLLAVEPSRPINS